MSLFVQQQIQEYLNPIQTKAEPQKQGLLLMAASSFFRSYGVKR